MATTRHNARFPLLIACLVLSIQAEAILPVSQLPISLDAESSEFDRNRNRLVFQSVKITQGTLTIEADAAVANDLDFAKSTWQFDGRVRIDGEGSHIRGESAQLVFSDHRLVLATTSGEPATFDREADEEVRALNGGAEVIQFNAKESTLVLEGSARIIDGPNEITGDRLLYNLQEERLVASSNEDGEQRVRIVITPQTLKEISGEDEKGDDPGPRQGEPAP